MKKHRETIIDFSDFLAKLLDSWKIVLIAVIVICGCFVLISLAKYRSALKTYEKRLETAEGQEKTPSAERLELQHDIEEAKAVLTPDEINEVERVSAQLSSYTEYREAWQVNFESYMLSSPQTEGSQVVKRTSYRLSSTIEGAENLFVNLALGIDDYKQILEYLPGAEEVSAAYNSVNISSVSGTDTTVTNLGDEKARASSQYLINVEVIGNSRSACDQMWEIIDNAFSRELEELIHIDSSASLVLIGSQYQGNVQDYIIKKQQSAFETIQKIDTTINNLRNNYIGKLSDEQTAYYELLQKTLNIEEEDSEDALKTPSFKINKKYLAAGFFAGLILGIIIVLLRYYYDGTVKTGTELERYYGMSVLQTFYVKKKGFRLFSVLVRKIRKADFNSDLRCELTGTDLNAILKKSGNESVYFAQTVQNAADDRVVSAIREAMASHSGAVSICTGAPLTDVVSFEELTEQAAAVVFVHMGKSLYRDVEKLVDYCERHKIRLIGAVSVIET